MSGAAFLQMAATVALGLMSLAFLLCIVRIAIGPTLADRVVALDLLVVIGVGYIAAVALLTGQMLYLDIAISIALVGFLATVALARFILKRGEAKPDRGDER